jgi:hypothetical protein
VLLSDSYKMYENNLNSMKNKLGEEEGWNILYLMIASIKVLVNLKRILSLIELGG